MKRIRLYTCGHNWQPLAWLLWDHDEQCLRVWDDETPIPQPALDVLTEAVAGGAPCGWLDEDTAFVAYDEQPPTHTATDRQRLGIRCDTELTADLIRDRLRAEAAKLDAAATRLRALLPKAVDTLRPNDDLDAVFTS